MKPGWLFVQLIELNNCYCNPFEESIKYIFLVLILTMDIFPLHFGEIGRKGGETERETFM